MRITPTQIDTIHSTAQAVLGEGARVILFGSRVDYQARGGDVDLMIEVPQALAEPALMSAQIANRLSRAFEGAACGCAPESAQFARAGHSPRGGTARGAAVKVAEDQWARLQFLSRIILKECQYL